MHTRFAIGNPTVSLILFLLLAVLGCDRSIVFPSGINGVALEETGGGNVNPPPPPTFNPLAGAIITVQSESGREMTRQAADSHGGFRIELPPGTYVLVPLVPPDLQFVLAPEPQTVVVLPDKLTQVVITYKVVSHF